MYKGYRFRAMLALVAQLDRVLPSEGKGREFESRQARQNLRTILGCRQVVRQRFLIPSFVGSNPASPAKTDKSLEIATFSLFYKHLILSMYSVSQKDCFQPYTDFIFKKSLFYNAPVLGCQFFIPERGRCIQTELR